MLNLFNTLGRRDEEFHPVNEKVVKIFTCGPSVYQRAHIGNFRTFLFEDILIRYLQYSGYTVRRGMNFTDIEDKALKEAEVRGMSVRQLTEENIKEFMEEMDLLKIRVPDYLPKASECVYEAVQIIERLLELQIAYWYKGNVYFDPLKYKGFGKLYGLNMDRWPTTKRRFHKDTYPGTQWNLGDFILWHGYKGGDANFWDSTIGRGRPSWNIQDPSMILKHFDETLSIYCGGIDNLFRHHDYTLAILESVTPYPMARFWLHCEHLLVNGKKMSKSKGTIYYTDTLLNLGYSIHEVRFFLVYSHYRQKLNYSDSSMIATACKLRAFRNKVAKIKARSDEKAPVELSYVQEIRTVFSERMDRDLNVRGAFDAVADEVSKVDLQDLKAGKASGIIAALMEIDNVLQVIF
ncbi:MAG: class I tRNA ligase family protein [Dissulfurispiraceae bacterium]